MSAPLMTADFSASFNLELIGKQMFAILRDELNDEVQAVQGTWKTIDQQYGILPTEVERIADENFYHGHRPSLIDAPIENYPNCSVMAYSATTQETDFDHEERALVRVFVELMCKSVTDEEEVNTRTQRTTDAVIRVVSKHPSLNGLVTEVANTPQVDISDVFSRLEQSSSGPKWFWQGARLEFAVQKYAGR